MSEPTLIFRCIHTVTAIGMIVAWFVTISKYRYSTKLTGMVIDGEWRVTYTDMRTGRQDQYWFPVIEFLIDGKTATTSPTLGYRSPLHIGTLVELTRLQTGEITAARFREKWMWTIIFAIPSVLFSFAWFAR